MPTWTCKLTWPCVSVPLRVMCSAEKLGNPMDVQKIAVSYPGHFEARAPLYRPHSTSKLKLPVLLLNYAPIHGMPHTYSSNSIVNCDSFSH